MIAMIHWRWHWHRLVALVLAGIFAYGYLSMDFSALASSLSKRYMADRPSTQPPTRLRVQDSGTGNVRMVGEMKTTNNNNISRDEHWNCSFSL